MVRDWGYPVGGWCVTSDVGAGCVGENERKELEVDGVEGFSAGSKACI